MLPSVKLTHQIQVETKTHRVRKPITRSRGKVRGQFPSKKMGRMVAWESQLERRACYLFEFSPEIVSFKEQPIKLNVPMHDRVHRYTPDFELTLDNGEVGYAEIKPKQKLENPELSVFLSITQQQLSNAGYFFKVMTEDDLVHPVREQNLILLRAHQTHPLSEELVHLAQGLILQHSDLCFSILVNAVGSTTTAYALIAHDYARIDLTQSINDNTPVAIGGSFI